MTKAEWKEGERKEERGRKKRNMDRKKGEGKLN